jgi:hypothetical protein
MLWAAVGIEKGTTAVTVMTTNSITSGLGHPVDKPLGLGLPRSRAKLGWMHLG